MSRWSSSRLKSTSLVVVILLLLSGCMYPTSETPNNEVSARESVITVQDAVDRYFTETELLPIQTADETVPIYEKYKIDFGKLKRTGYMANVPKMAFENGGTYQFLIIDEVTKPTVKLLSIIVYQQVDVVQTEVRQYRNKNGNANPAGDEVYPGFASVDFKKLGVNEPTVRSVFSNQPLNLLVDQNGQVFVDYGIDIATAISKSEVPPKAGEDLRRYLLNASHYVPVKSTAYHWVNDGPQAVAQ
ncbi:MAG: DUF3939 domain-containing protein [Candidatus Cohnella colombiensis]|uniref:DUF3939 domain-containing protein n=1 Tax=Candidatus Cohnella colombiensis TaxID=3121368 RepID=A0AA95EZS8_9BACL|nr:MAG: DUF3939 domain-containing protein [Cohnella sp.]